MRWPEVVAALVARVGSDPEWVALVGGPGIHASHDLHSKGATGANYTLTSETLTENTEEIVLQWDVYAPSGQAVAMLRRLRQLVTAEGVVDVGGVQMWMRFQTGRAHPPPSAGVSHHSFEALYILTKEEA